jgi:hypothetical protein
MEPSEGWEVVDKAKVEVIEGKRERENCLKTTETIPQTQQLITRHGIFISSVFEKWRSSEALVCLPEFLMTSSIS